MPSAPHLLSLQASVAPGHHGQLKHAVDSQLPSETAWEKTSKEKRKTNLLERKGKEDN